MAAIFINTLTAGTAITWEELRFNGKAAGYYTDGTVAAIGYCHPEYYTMSGDRLEAGYPYVEVLAETGPPWSPPVRRRIAASQIRRVAGVAA